LTDPRDAMLCGLKAIATHIGRSEDATWRLCRAHELPAFKLGRRWHMRQGAPLILIAAGRCGNSDAHGPDARVVIARQSSRCSRHPGRTVMLRSTNAPPL
jgi:hypothetical protein